MFASRSARLMSARSNSLVRPARSASPKTQYLHLRLRIVNSGVERDIPLSGWAAGRNADSIRVVDPKGTVLKPAAFEENWQPERGKPSERLFPDQSSEVTLIFACSVRQGRLAPRRVARLSGGIE